MEWKKSASLLHPESRELLRFELKNGMLRNVLSPCVPMLAASSTKKLFDSTMKEAGLTADHIDGWVFHGGGREVLAAVQEAFALEPAQLEGSARILRAYGNLSSPFVLFVLQSALNNGAKGGLWWMTAFGAGFSCHGALLEVGEASPPLS